MVQDQRISMFEHKPVWSKAGHIAGVVFGSSFPGEAGGVRPR